MHLFDTQDVQSLPLLAIIRRNYNMIAFAKGIIDDESIHVTESIETMLGAVCMVSHKLMR